MFISFYYLEGKNAASASLLRVLLTIALISNTNPAKSTAQAKGKNYVLVKGWVCGSQEIWALEDHTYPFTQEQWSEENLVLAVILLLLMFFYISLDFTLALRSVLEALVEKMKGGNIICNVIQNQKLYISLWFWRAKDKGYQLRQLQ